MLKKSLHLSVSAVVLTAALGLPTLVQAQDGAPPPPGVAALEEIVVTAQRRAENLQNVPIAVTALSADTLAKQGVTDVKLLATAVPGLTFTTQATLAAPRIRGVGTAIAGAGNENPVAVYVDGVYYSSAGATVLSFNNIAQIAVLKGPQGTLFGRNATGGLIQITTRDPSETFGGKIEATAGNHDTLGADLYLTGGVATGVAADIAVHYHNQMDGFGTNTFNGDDINKARDFAVRSKVRGEFGNVDATLILDYDHSVSAMPAWRPVSGTLPLGGVPYTGGKFDTNSNLTPKSDVEQYGAAFKLGVDLEFAKAVSLTAYRHSNWDVTFDSDALPQEFISADLLEPSRQFSQEFQLISQGEGPFTWQAGLFYFWMRDGFLPGQVRLPLFGIVQNLNTKQTTKSYAAYVQGTYKFTEATSLTVGGRLTHEKKSELGSGSLVILANNAVIPQGPYTADLKATKPTWRLALDHKLDERTLIYVSYNRGFKSGGFDPSATVAAASFKPEVLDAYEVGLKTELLDRRVRLNTAAFYYDYKDIQLNTFKNGLTSIYNGSSAKIYGMDADLTAAVTENLTLKGGLSLIHGRYGDFPITATAPNPAGGLIPLPDISAKGKKIQNTPEVQFNAGFEYRVPVSSGSLTLVGNYFHSGRWYNTPENRLSQKPYDLFDASATWAFGPDERYAVRLWGKNLTNTAYAEQLTIQIPVLDFVAISPGRSFGATVSAEF